MAEYKRSNWDIKPSYDYEGKWEVFHIGHGSYIRSVHDTHAEALAAARKLDRENR